MSSESKGGPTELKNLQVLCRSCNSWKGARLEEELDIDSRKASNE